MNVPLRHTSSAHNGATQQLTIVDCDIHPAYRTARRPPSVPARRAGREHMTTFGEHLRQGLSGQLAWPRMMAAGMRLETLIPSKGRPVPISPSCADSISTPTASNTAC